MDNLISAKHVIFVHVYFRAFDEFFYCAFSCFVAITFVLFKQALVLTESYTMKTYFGKNNFVSSSQAFAAVSY